ncbi:MAG TPA: biotin--[acetyl-CoA-carboxylase] ligase [Tepidisphaeraceae bacterium]|jgi:BirA family biotin operon repressor/biotin-[acetyl-CoA-carboxylase] ligase
MSSNAFQLSSLRERLKPFRLYFYTRLRSTNDHAAVMRRARKLYAPAIVLAASQTAGRGRGSNTWWSGRGSLTVTFCLPTDDRLPPHHVPLLAGWAVREACIGLTGVDRIQMKWPNDLWHDGLKLSGLLCERLDGVDLVGVGLNVNVQTADIPGSLRHRVTGLQAIAGRTLAMNDVVAALAGSVDRWLLKRTGETFAALLGQYDRAHALHGRSVRVTEPGEGVPVAGDVRGLDAEGRLLLQTPGGMVRIVAGHVDLA